MKSAYKEEDDKFISLQNELNNIIAKNQKELVDSLSEKELLYSNLAEQITSLKNTMLQINSEATNESSKVSTEMDAKLTIINKENNEIEKRIESLREQLNTNEKMLLESKNNLQEKVDNLNKDIKNEKIGRAHV